MLPPKYEVDMIAQYCVMAYFMCPWDYFPRIGFRGPLARQPSLPWQPVCAPLVVGSTTLTCGWPHN